MKFINNLTDDVIGERSQKKEVNENIYRNGTVQQFQEPVNAHPAQQDVQRRSNGNDKYVADFNSQKDSKVAV
jgi:hypothetical protein